MMSTDLPYQILLAGIALIVVVYFVLRAWTYGVVRPVVSALSLAAGIGAGAFTYLKANSLLVVLKFRPEPISTTLFGVVVGLAGFLLLRKIGHDLADWMFSAESFVGRYLDRSIGAILSLVPAFAVMACLVSAVRIWGTFAELRHVAVCSELYSDGESHFPPIPPAIKVRNAFEKITVATAILDRYDPYSSKAKRNLVGLAVISYHYTLFLKLGTHRLAVEIYTQPDVQELLESPKVAPLFEAPDFRVILKNRRFISTSEIPEIVDKLEYLDMIEVLYHGLEA